MSDAEKTPAPDQPGGGQDAGNMGGPSFHPKIGEQPKSSGDKKESPSDGGPLLDDAQIPAVTPPEE